MKKLLVGICLVSSVSAFATDFTAKMEDVNCTIKNGVVTRTQTFGKDALGSITETKTVKMNAEALIMKAMETSSQLPAGADDEYVYTMIHEGKSYTLTTSDSKESMFLIRMITKSCR